jgi:hypothetical protein
MINKQYNYNDSFPRMISISLIKTLTRCITYINYTETEKIRVSVPFYLSMSGNESYLLDAFVDDIPNSRVELNTDQIPRGIVTLISLGSKSDELTNPNMYLSKKGEINGVFKEIVTKVKAVPVTLNYDIDIVVMTEIDAYKITEKIYNMLFNYMFFNIDYFGIKIDINLILPDDFQIEIIREQTMDTDNKKHIKFSVGVESYYPIFQTDFEDHIVCNNDNSPEMELYWAKGCKKKPTLNEDITSIKRVNWKAYIWDLDYADDKQPTDEERKNVPPENF